MTTYNEQCARVWNQPRFAKPTYRIERTGYRLDRFIVMEVHGGWAVGIGTVFSTKEDAEQFIKEQTK